jgi:hypothetical protein
VTFTPEEAGFLLSTKVNGLILTALELSDVFNDLLQLIRLYSDRRDAMTASLPVSVMEGSLAAMDLNAKAALALAKLTTPLTSLFNGIAGRVDVDYAQAKQTFDVLRAHCVERFGTDFPKLEMIEPPAPSPSSDGATPTA